LLSIFIVFSIVIKAVFEKFVTMLPSLAARGTVSKWAIVDSASISSSRASIPQRADINIRALDSAISLIWLKSPSCGNSEKKWPLVSISKSRIR